MEKTKLIATLKKLDKKEWRDLNKFVRSEYHNQHEQVIALFEYYTTVNLEIIQPETVFAHLYPKQKYDDQKLHYLNSLLLEVTESFLAIEKWKNTNIEKNLYKIKSQQEKGLDKAFKQTFLKTSKQLEKQPLRNSTYFQKTYELHLEEFNFNEAKGRKMALNLQDLSDSFDLYYLSNKLKTACIMLSHKSVLDQEFDMGLLPFVLEYIQKKQGPSHPAIAVYYYAYLALTEKDSEKHFTSLKNILLENNYIFPIDELKDIYLLAINYCIKKINMGESKYVGEVLTFYKSGLEVNIFYKNNILSSNTYYNINMAALKEKQFDWALKFLNKYKNKLKKEEQESSHQFNMAILYFKKPDYKKAMELFIQAEFTDPYYNIIGRRMLLQIYYELGEYEALNSLLTSNKNYIYRQKNLGYHREVSLNLIKFIQKLLYINPSSKAEKKALQTEIENCNPLIEKEWLLKQLQKS